MDAAPGWWTLLPIDVQAVLPRIALDDTQGVRVLAKRLEKALYRSAWGRYEAEDCLITWFTQWYNLKRVVRTMQSRGFIVAMRFDAIMDSLVSDQCEVRNGLLIAVGDSLLLRSVPPLHHGCRSVLSPISGYKLERMGGQARLDADRARLQSAPPPEDGYGGVVNPLATLQWMDDILRRRQQVSG